MTRPAQPVGAADVEVRLVALIRALDTDVDVSRVDAATSIPALGLDSLTILQLIASAEDEFDVEIRDDELVDINTLGELAALIAGSGYR